MSLHDDPTLSELRREVTETWAVTARGRLDTYSTAANRLSVPLGDLHRMVRDVEEGGVPDGAGFGRELYNLALTALRAAEDLGLDHATCLRRALLGQRAYAEALAAEEMM